MTTALPSPHVDPHRQQLRRLLHNQDSLYERMESLKGSHSQTAIVSQLLSLNPSERGSAQ